MDTAVLLAILFTTTIVFISAHHFALNPSVGRYLDHTVITYNNTLVRTTEEDTIFEVPAHHVGFCLASCQATNECRAVNYNKVTNQCFLLKSGLSVIETIPNMIHADLTPLPGSPLWGTGPFHLDPITRRLQRKEVLLQYSGVTYDTTNFLEYFYGVQGIAQCISICNHRPACNAINYNKRDKECFLLQQGMGWIGSSPDFAHYKFLQEKWVPGLQFSFRMIPEE